MSSTPEHQVGKALPRATLRPVVARWLKEAIGDKPISSVAKGAGVSRGTIYAILKGESDADDPTIAKLATALGVAPPRADSRSPWADLLAVLARLPKQMQRDIAVRAVRQGIEAQELHGRGLLRAMLSLCTSLDELGYAAMAREIRSEMLKAMAADLAKPEPGDV